MKDPRNRLGLSRLQGAIGLSKKKTGWTWGKQKEMAEGAFGLLLGKGIKDPRNRLGLSMLQGAIGLFKNKTGWTWEREKQDCVPTCWTVLMK